MSALGKQKFIIFVLAVFLAFSVILNVIQFCVYIRMLPEPSGNAHIYGWVMENRTYESRVGLFPIPYAHVGVFLGISEEEPLFNYRYLTDSNGFYNIYMNIKYPRQEDEVLEITAFKEGYYVSGIRNISLNYVLKVSWNVNFTMIKEPALP